MTRKALPKRKKSQRAPFVTIAIMTLAMFILGYSIFLWMQKKAQVKSVQPKQDQVNAAELWHKLKRRLLDQDLPTKAQPSRKKIDILDIASKSNREDPENTSPSKKDRRNLEQILQKTLQ